MTLRPAIIALTAAIALSAALLSALGTYSIMREALAAAAQTKTEAGSVSAPAGWTLLYQHDALGEPLAGSNTALIAAIRSGQPIRIGWGVSVTRDGESISVEHVISPEFLSIVNGAEVSAQLPEHIAQRSYLEIDQAFFEDPAVMWRGLMTTRGTFEAVWVNRGTGEVVRRWPQRAALSWYAPSSPDPATPSLAAPGGVQRDASRADEQFPVSE